MTTLVALALVSQQPVFSQAVLSGIVVTEFDTPQARIQVYLPDDMAAGDTISGTVFAEPKGEGAAREANAKLVEGLVVSIDQTIAERTGQRIILRSLDKLHKLSRSLRVRLSTESAELTAPIEVDEERTDKTLQFVIPEVNSAGRPMQIAGPFDGDIGSTRVTVGGKAATVFVETPRSCIVQADTSFVGKKSVIVSDGGVTKEGSVYLPKIVLSAGKTALMRGESTVLTVTVQGLDDAPRTIFPIPVEIKNLSPNVISLATYTNFAVTFEDVRDGEWKRQITLTSINPGSYTVSGLLYGVSLHEAKRAMTPSDFRDWCRALIVVYEQKIKDLQPQANEAGINENIAIKQNLVRVLRTAAGASTEGEKNLWANAVDKELATQSFFAVASDLVSMAADFLGYTSIPMPNVGTLLKGIAVIAKGSAAATQAVKSAQDIYDALSKVQGAQEKLNKAKELQEALKKVQEALR